MKCLKNKHKQILELYRSNNPNFLTRNMFTINHDYIANILLAKKKKIARVIQIISSMK